MDEAEERLLLVEEVDDAYEVDETEAAEWMEDAEELRECSV